MTPAQFEALAQLLRLRTGPAREAVRLHLVTGLSVPDAARAAGLPYAHAWQACQRASAGLELAKVAVG